MGKDIYDEMADLEKNLKTIDDIWPDPFPSVTDAAKGVLRIEVIKWCKAYKEQIKLDPNNVSFTNSCQARINVLAEFFNISRDEYDNGEL